MQAAGLNITACFLIEKMSGLINCSRYKSDSTPADLFTTADSKSSSSAGIEQHALQQQGITVTKAQISLGTNDSTILNIFG